MSAPSLDIESLRTHLLSVLPEYMAPAAYVQLEALPLAPNGKLDRRALPAPQDGAYLRRGEEAPQGETERRIASIWSEVLKLKRVGRHDNFFELGGHSLLAITLTERMRREGLHADVRALFAAPTPSALAMVVRTQSEHVQVPPNRIGAGCERITPDLLPLVNLSQTEIDRIVGTVPGGATNVQDIYPLLPLQEGILFHHLMAAQGDVYLTPALFAFDTYERLQRYLAALQAVVERHEILRTAVVWEELSEPVQVVWRRAALQVKELDLDGATGDIAEQLLARFDPRKHRIDITQAPLFRMHVCHDPLNRRWLLLELHHHLSSDHTTLASVQEEMQAHLLNRFDALPAPLPFRNFVAHARAGVSREEHEAFFKQMLGDVEEPTAPFGLMDVQSEGRDATEAWCEADAELTQRLRSCARALGVTAASVCHVAWALVLARTTGRNDVVFGTVLFGRMQGGEGADRVLGMFINTLPVRLRVDGLSVSDSVRQAHAVLAQLLYHEHAPLALAQRCSAVVAPHPLFSSLFNYRHGAPAALSRDAQCEADAAWTGIRLLSAQERTNYPLTLAVDDLGDRIGLTVRAVGSVNAEAVCAMVYTALESLAAGLQQTPDVSVQSLEVLPTSERQRLLFAWNDTADLLTKSHCVHELFQAQVARTPNAVAVMYEGRGLTYLELNAQANQLARYLRREYAVQPDGRVAICMDRGLEMLVSLLAVLKAGSAYVPLDPSYPPERLKYMLEDCGAVVLLTRASSSSRLLPLGNEHQTRVLDVSADSERWASESKQNLPAERLSLSSCNLAYVIYTSGSSGTPKGVMVEHAAAVNLWHALEKVAFNGCDPSCKASLNASLAFDASLQGVLQLLSGRCVVIVPQTVRSDPVELLRFIERNEIDVFDCTPVQLDWLLAAGLADGGRRKPRRLLVGGEAISPTVWSRLRELSAPLFFNVYGPTECTVDASIALINGSSAGPSIGAPVSNAQLYILDQRMQAAPVCVVGEIYIGGAGVARGYLNRPALTAERFLANPFRGEGRERIYKTGDLGRYRANGLVEYMGRNDSQVKIRGFRLELGEIETRLLDHPAIRAAVVVAREDELDEKRLVAYVVSDECVDEDTLRAHLAKSLPDYMIPAAFVSLPEIPLTTNGKVNRLALPAPDRSAAVTRSFEAPIGELEQLLAEAWGNILKLERVGRHDSLFDFGGHSISVLKVVARLQSAGVRTSVATVFAHPTVALLAKRLSQGIEERAPRGAVLIREGVRRPLFLVHDVHGDELYFPVLAAQVNREIPVYGLPGVPLDESPPQSMQDLAVRMVAIVRNAQPYGPYRLAGWSFGGSLAYEIAAQLLQQREAVEFLGLFDSHNAGEIHTANRFSPQAELLGLCWQERSLTESQRHPLAELHSRIESVTFDEVLEQCKRLRALPEYLSIRSDAHVLGFCRRAAAHSYASAHYRPQPLPILVHLFLANEQPKSTAAYLEPAQLLGWRDVCSTGGIRVLPVPGNHGSLMSAPNVEVVGRVLSQAIDEIEGET